LIQYLNRVANFQLQFVDHVAWYQVQQQLLQPSNICIYLRHFFDHHAQEVLDQSDGLECGPTPTTW
jgi:hypothetical protein